jgi:hypothetical protein
LREKATVENGSVHITSFANGGSRWAILLTVRLGRQADALFALSDGFATGRRGGHYNTIPWLPKMMTQLDALALQEGIETEYVEELGVRRGLHYVAGISA